MRRVVLANILIAGGVAAWVPYGIFKYLLGHHPPILPFLVVHLCGVLPGGYLKLRRRLEKRRNTKLPLSPSGGED